MLKEFKEFALKGNIIELAVAVVIGAAFGSIVSSLVDDVITPLVLAPAMQAAKVGDLDKLVWGTVHYGRFLSAIIKFVIVAFTLFLVVKGMTRLLKKEKEAAAKADEKVTLLKEIRDLLAKSNKD
jgi:large conductance mechanosensitive channel